MLFVKREDLRIGMRLARPIYNKNGVLLYERNSKLTQQGIESISNFGLIGIFILEPAEPAPPMTEEDLEFERFQTMCVYSLQEELEKILQTKRTNRLQMISSDIIRNYGHLDKKINFVQNLRSKEDYHYKHSMNVAMLCAMITHRMNVMVGEQLETIEAALIHDIGKLTLSDAIREREFLDEAGRAELRAVEVEGYNLVDAVFPTTPNVKRICAQAQKAVESAETGEDISAIKMLAGAKVLAVAETFDTMTAVQIGTGPVSEVAALRYLMEHPKAYDPEAVRALISSINILAPGVSVELNTGEKALVLTENTENILRPMILMFNDNSIIDLGNDAYEDLEIKDIMKTMDNRYVMNIDLLRRQGFQVEEPAFVEVPKEA